MGKQKLEGVFRGSVQQYPQQYYYIKLQNIPLSHQACPGDFFVFSHLFNYLVECKECRSEGGKGSFVFDRLSQEQELIRFEKFDAKHKSFLLLMFRERMMKDSDIYLIPIFSYTNMKENIDKKSINREDAKLYFKNFKVEVLKGGFLDILPHLK